MIDISRTCQPIADSDPVATPQARARQPGTDISEAYCLFQQPWWLDAVAPGQWSAAEVRHGGEVLARMPFVTRKRYGATYITRPGLTPTLGPWFKPSTAKYASRLRHEKDQIESLLAQLPQHVYCSISCSPEVTNVLPFHWAGFDLHVRYTYTIPDISDRERVWAGFLTNVRGHIRSAEKTLAVREDLGLEDFLHTYEQVFRGKNHKMPFSWSFLERVDQALASRQQRRMFFAVDAQERVHAAVYLVWDHNKAYYLMGGRDPGFSSSSAVSLLIWHAIQHAASVATLFDFEGSMIEPIERFFRDFGAVQTPYYRLTRANNRLVRAALALWGTAS